MRWCKTCCAGTLSACDCAATAINNKRAGQCKTQHSFPERTTIPDSQTALRAQHLHVLQEQWELVALCKYFSHSMSARRLGPSGRSQEMSAGLCQMPEPPPEKRQEPDTHPGIRYVFGHGSLDHCFWPNHIGHLIPIHLLAVLGALVLSLERYSGDASFFPFSCLIDFKAFSSPFPSRTCISGINCSNRIISF